MAVRSATRPMFHRGHFAFMRAVLQGLDANASWDRYLALSSDLSDRRRASMTTRGIADAFAAAARRHGKPGTARLILMGQNQVAEGALAPSLDEFVQMHGWEEFPVSTQMEEYAAHYGPAAARPSRRARLISRQLEALAWLEQVAAQRPSPADRARDWFAPTLALRMEKAGITTLTDLLERTRTLGDSWFKAVPGVGPSKAARVLEWLNANLMATESSLQTQAALPAAADRACAPCLPPQALLWPFELFVSPVELNGSAGANRLHGQVPSIAATNDYEAIQCWLASKAREGDCLSATQRAYRKEAERLLLWSVLVLQKPVSSLDQADASSFLEFLAAPPASWCGQRYHERTSAAWRPMEAALPLPARARTARVLDGLFTWLIEQAYLAGNPFVGLADRTI